MGVRQSASDSDGFPLKDEGYAILGAVFEVYKVMGCGFLEAVYQECLEYEFEDRGIPFEANPNLTIDFKKRRLKRKYQPDFLCFSQIVVELKAVSALIPEYRAQLHNYLKVSGMTVGYLVNFGHFPLVEYERIIRTDPEKGRQNGSTNGEP
ncbi:MAG: GxxExxY protein [Acidobacteria bacterium]|nr:GxxExxY protein [Acidobacteriota bacterium]